VQIINFRSYFFTSQEDEFDSIVILSLLLKYSINIYSLNNVSDIGKMDFKEILKSLYKTNILENLVAPAPIVVSGAIIN